MKKEEMKEKLERISELESERESPSSRLLTFDRITDSSKIFIRYKDDTPLNKIITADGTRFTEIDYNIWNSLFRPEDIHTRAKEILEEIDRELEFLQRDPEPETLVLMDPDSEKLERIKEIIESFNTEIVSGSMYNLMVEIEKVFVTKKDKGTK
ncbi:MAG: hypothetical protein NUV97_00600 [archaeon]|nr:hypothetical protein [archaeon]